jgi:hypothetical protein
MRHRPSRRCANERVKPGGMCCAIITAGESGGSGCSTSRMASVPPVEAPMMMSFSVLSSGLRSSDSCGASAAGAHGRRHAAGLQARAGGRADLAGDELGVVEQPVAHAQARLGHEVDGAQLQRAQRDLRAALGKRRHHHHRHGPQAHELLEKLQPVHARHFHVEREHVGVGDLDEVARHQRVGRGAHHGHVGWLLMISVITLRISAESSTHSTLIFLTLTGFL